MQWELNLNDLGMRYQIANLRKRGYMVMSIYETKQNVRNTSVRKILNLRDYSLVKISLVEESNNNSNFTVYKKVTYSILFPDLSLDV